MQPLKSGQTSLHGLVWISLWGVSLLFVCRWMCWSPSSLSCFSRSTPPEILRASDWLTTTSWATCWPSPSSSWSQYAPASPVTPYCWSRVLSFQAKWILLHPGFPLLEWDPWAVSKLLLSGQPEHGVARREGNCSAGPPGQGGATRALTYFRKHEYFYLLLYISDFRASDVSLHCCLRSSRASGTIKLTRIWLSCSCGWTTTNTIHRPEGLWAGRTQTIII